MRQASGCPTSITSAGLGIDAASSWVSLIAALKSKIKILDFRFDIKGMQRCEYLTISFPRSVCDFSVGSLVARIFGKTATPKSSLLSLGKRGLFIPGTKEYPLAKSSTGTCFEQIAEFFVGSHLAGMDYKIDPLSLSSPCMWPQME